MNPKPSTPADAPRNIFDLVQFAGDGIVSRVVDESHGAKVVLFCFDNGQRMSEHTSTRAAHLLTLQGTGTVILGGREQEARPGAFFAIAPDEPHAVRADRAERFVLLVTLLKR